ncbi:hypothetical protein B2J93_4955 [Marssonina coronariae]|uniref:Uncharacterized protein n=1 Tax=Diplocarpon coronariae TaxID=2795749 RepID=A0A218ZJN0_9HELO|nr:hypothetical protein B2J93_4955 [Marssonina coronariae]
MPSAFDALASPEMPRVERFDRLLDIQYSRRPWGASRRRPRTSTIAPPHCSRRHAGSFPGTRRRDAGYEYVLVHARCTLAAAIHHLVESIYSIHTSKYIAWSASSPVVAGQQETTWGCTQPGPRTLKPP